MLIVLKILSINDESQKEMSRSYFISIFCIKKMKPPEDQIIYSCRKEYVNRLQNLKNNFNKIREIV